MSSRTPIQIRKLGIRFELNHQDIISGTLNFVSFCTICQKYNFTVLNELSERFREIDGGYGR